MRGGRLYHRVSIQARAETQNAYGERNWEWSELASRRASIEPLNGREYFNAVGENSTVTTRIRVRYDVSLDGLQADDRVMHGDDQYDIESVIKPQQRGGELVIMARLSRDDRNG